MPQKNRHSLVVIRLVAWLLSIFAEDRVRTQATICLNESNLPEPDAFVLNRELPASQSYPAPADVAFIAEVSDTTLDDDLEVKARLYGAAGVPEYWVLDIENRRLIVHRRPTSEGYAEVFTRNEDESQSLLACPEALVNVANMFPPIEDAPPVAAPDGIG